MPGVVSQLPAGKSINYGLETVTELMWIGWEPGREYTKHIILKNVRVKTQKVKYKYVISILCHHRCNAACSSYTTSSFLWMYAPQEDMES